MNPGLRSNASLSLWGNARKFKGIGLSRKAIQTSKYNTNRSIPINILQCMFCACLHTYQIFLLVLHRRYKIYKETSQCFLQQLHILHFYIVHLMIKSLGRYSKFPAVCYSLCLYVHEDFGMLVCGGIKGIRLRV